MKSCAVFLCVWVFASLPGLPVQAQGAHPFSPLANLNSPSANRLADGRPGPDYWQQHVDYRIEAALDLDRKTLSSQGVLTYTNNAPTPLNQIWFELALNVTQPSSIAQRSVTSAASDLSLAALTQVQQGAKSKGGTIVTSVTSARGEPLQMDLQGTSLRVELNEPLAPGAKTTLHLAWDSVLVDIGQLDARFGYSQLPGEPLIFHVAQWYPQPVAYTDYAGWRNTPFVDAGEFAPEMGDYTVSITVPEGVVIAATGQLMNPKAALTPIQHQRLKTIVRGRPTAIITADEARGGFAGAEKKVWRFEAKSVRDFAFAASTQYRWDAMQADRGDGQDITVMSFYPERAAPLWRPFSLAAMAHAVDVYGRHVFPYPYPVVQAAYGPVAGMEHSTLAFSSYAPDGLDGLRYSRDMKRVFLWVLIHEVGHNWFPLIVNSDERAWGWMDEGMTSFVEHLALLEWSDDYVSRPNSPRALESFKDATAKEPPMTPASAVTHLFASQYNRPAAALMVLREVVLGRARFDRAFKAYAGHWRFKRPTPSDFFRTINQEAGEDLSWFWRGWFYSTDHVDLELKRVVQLAPVLRTAINQAAASDDDHITQEDLTLSRNRVEGITQLTKRRPSLADVYDVTAPRPNPSPSATPTQMAAAQEKLDELSGEGFYYIVEIENVGGVLSPVPFELIYDNGQEARMMIPVEIWYSNQQKARHLFFSKRRVKSMTLDPDYSIADVRLVSNGRAMESEIVSTVISVSGSPAEFRQ